MGVHGSSYTTRYRRGATHLWTAACTRCGYRAPQRPPHVVLAGRPIGDAGGSASIEPGGFQEGSECGITPGNAML